jgi:hypothetical protein
VDTIFEDPKSIIMSPFEKEAVANKPFCSFDKCCFTSQLGCALISLSWLLFDI